MAYSVNWLTGVITIPASDLTLRSGNVYELQADDFWRESRRLNWTRSEGLWAPQIHTRLSPRVVGGVLLPAEQLLNPYYSITFDPAIDAVFLLGDNNNIFDVVNFNGVSVVPSNSAGNTISETGVSGLTSDESSQLSLLSQIQTLVDELHKIHGLSLGNPMTVTPTSRDVANTAINQTLTGDGEASTTVTRL